MHAKHVGGLVALALVGQVAGADSNWIAASGKWEEPASWDAGGVPAAGVTAFIANGGICLIDDATPYTGGTQAANGTLYVGYEGGTGTLDIVSSMTVNSGFSSGNRYIGYNAVGVVNVDGTKNTQYKSRHYIGSGANGDGTLNLVDGYVNGVTDLGYDGGRGTINMQGGYFFFSSYLTVGNKGGTGIINLSGGTDYGSQGGTFGGWRIVMDGTSSSPSELNILDASVVISMVGTATGTANNPTRNGIGFGQTPASRVKLTAVPGSMIKFSKDADADIVFYTGGPVAAADLAGLNNITLVYKKNNLVVEESGDDKIPDNRFSQLEIGGVDMGAKMAGFTENFSLDGLTLQTPVSRTGYSGNNTVQLVDNYANAGTQGQEVLYVKTLTMEESTVLDLNGKKLYYVDGDFAAGTIVNGTPIQVPLIDPTTLIIVR